MRETTVKEQVIGVLVENWPLKPKKIHSALRKKGKAGITYHNMHFALRELLRNGVVAQAGKAYYLNPSWVAENLEKFESVFSSYVKYGLLRPRQPFQELAFNSIWEAFNFALDEIRKEVQPGCAVYVQVARLFPLPLPENYVQAVRDLAKTTKIVVLCRLKGIAEKLTANHLKGLGIEVYLGVSSAIMANSILINGRIMTFHVSYKKAELEGFNKFYFALKSATKEDILLPFLDFVRAPARVNVTIIQNREVYDDFLAQTKKLLPAAVQ